MTYYNDRLSSRSKLAVSLAAAVATLLVAAAPATAAPHNTDRFRHRTSARAAYVDSAVVESRRAESKEIIGDLSLATVTANAWRWLTTLPFPIFEDTSGANCGVAQEGPFWYLAPPFGVSAVTNCTVPSGKTIVAWVAGAGYIWNNCPGDFDGQPTPNARDLFADSVAPLVDEVVGPAAKLDGQRLRVRRVVSDVFSFTAGDDWVAIPDGCFTGRPQIGLSDGYFIFIPPLPRGNHTLTMTLHDPATTSIYNLRIL